MTDAPLTPPASWAEQIRAVPLAKLALRHYPSLALPAGWSLDAVARDLEAGAWLVRARSARDEHFRLGGTEFELRVRRQQGRDTHVWMAVVLNVDEARSVPRKAGRIIPRRVDFDTVKREAECDLEELEAELRRRQQYLRPDGRGGVAGQAEVRAHGWLQAEVRRQYGELRTLIDVLEQRPERPEVTTVGTVVAPESRQRGGRQPTIVVAARTDDPGAFRSQRVELVRPDGRSFNTRVIGVRGRRLEIAEPRDWPAAPGQEIRVAVVPPFGMRQNAEALERFLAGKLEGSWDDLARLLCRPVDLALPARLSPPAWFYCDDDPDAPVLNDEQRQAVTGAVGSPHAYFVQGPPGTGKSEVICETIRQLVGRGERVLLLAPAHVAVDEVLHRIGRKTGIRPLRITWNDNLVDEKLRAFLPRNVGIEATRRILRPSDHGQAARWARELKGVEQRLDAVAELRDIVRRRADAVLALQPAAAAADAAAKQLRDRAAEADEAVATLERALAGADQELALAFTAARNAAQLAETERASAQPGLEVLSGAATELLTANLAEADAQAAMAQAGEALRLWSAAHQAQLAAAAQARAGAERSAAEADRQLSRATQVVEAARASLSDTIARQTAVGRFAERLGLGSVTEARKAAADAEAVERRWHAEVVEREVSWRVSTVTYNDLVRRAAGTRNGLERRVTTTRSVHEDAVRARLTAFGRFADALVAAGASLPPAFAVTTTAADWADIRRLCLALRAAVEAVLDPGAWVPDIAAVTSPLRLGGLAPVIDTVERLWHAEVARERTDQELAAATRRRDDRATELRQARLGMAAVLMRLTAERDATQEALAARRGELEALTARRDTLVGIVGGTSPADAEAALLRRRHVLQHLPALDLRWRELAAERSDEQLGEDVRTSLVRATNLVCATTKGIVSRGSDLVRHTDYDTLIVDEASRVTESEFLIGAVKARRWVLVGDEHQLPPHVDQDDEHYLHALTALHRVHRGASPSLKQAVIELADLWAEDEELRVFRTESVEKIATGLDAEDQGRSTSREQFAEAHKRFARIKQKGGDADRLLLAAMVRYLVQSLFQRGVVHCPQGLRQRLIWQRRMIAPLARVVNQPIYGGHYRSPSEAELAQAGVRPLVLPRIFERPAVLIDTSRYRDAEDTQIHHGFVNEREQRLVVRACEIYNEQLGEPVTASVLAFYRAQARALERQLLSRDLPMLDWQVIDVIDRIQGQQSDLVVLSFTRARRAGLGPRYGQWLQDVRRLNVACTRARRALVLVGHGDTLRRLGASVDGEPANAQAEKAKAFYANLFGLFGSGGDYLRIWRL